MKYFGDLELVNGSIINLVAERVPSNPTFDPADEGKIIYNFSQNAYFFNNGSAWLRFEVANALSDNLIDALGTEWINPDRSFNPSAFNALDNISGLGTEDSLFNVIEQLDTAITNAQTVTNIAGVNLGFDENDLFDRYVIYYDGAVWTVGSVDELDRQTILLDELEDVQITGECDCEVLSFDLTSELWINRKVYHKFEDISALNSSWIVNHNFGNKYCTVTVLRVDGDNETIVKDDEINEIVLLDNNRVSVSLNSSTAVRILVQSVPGTNFETL